MLYQKLYEGSLFRTAKEHILNRKDNDDTTRASPKKKSADKAKGA
jgi:hypothetical protein